jgi:hypothetical protein
MSAPAAGTAAALPWLVLTSDPAFVPPFCPKPTCAFHRDSTGWRFDDHGTFTRKAPPHVIRRFRCPTCRRTFSTQTFDTTYWLKKPHLQRPILDSLAACSAFRQTGRGHRVAASSVQRQASRLGRHCLLYHLAHAPTAPPTEHLALDGFVTFEYSQYWPFEINLLVGADSHFLYGFTESALRRSGRMTSAQKERRAELEARFGRPASSATRDAVEALVRLAAPEPATLRVRSDEHAAYPRAFRRLPHAITHSTVSSRRCRTWNNPLFAVDLLDLLIRHGSSNHKRETIAFSKRRQGALERMAVLQVWRNHQKRRSEQRHDSLTPAQALGLATHALTQEELLYRRLFPTRIAIPAPLDDVYWRRVQTRQVPNGTRHALKYAA